jgi:hypothetical protein
MFTKCFDLEHRARWNLFAVGAIDGVDLPQVVRGVVESQFVVSLLM